MPPPPLTSLHCLVKPGAAPGGHLHHAATQTSPEQSNYYRVKDPVNSGHLSITATFDSLVLIGRYWQVSQYCCLCAPCRVSGWIRCWLSSVNQRQGSTAEFWVIWRHTMTENTQITCIRRQCHVLFERHLFAKDTEGMGFSYPLWTPSEGIQRVWGLLYPF